MIDVATAVAAERERCAKVVEQLVHVGTVYCLSRGDGDGFFDGALRALEMAARNIRNGK